MDRFEERETSPSEPRAGLGWGVAGGHAPIGQPLAAVQRRPQVQLWRQQNLRAIAHRHGGISALSRLMGYKSHVSLSLLAGGSPRRPITDKLARQFEGVLNLPMGALDRPPALMEQVGTSEPGAAQRGVLCARAVREMSCVLENQGVRLSLADEQWFVRLLDAIVAGHAPAGPVRRGGA